MAVRRLPSRLRPPHLDDHFGSYLAVPLTSGGGLLSGVKLKKEDQELTSGSKSACPANSHTPQRPQTPACSHEDDI